MIFDGFRQFFYEKAIEFAFFGRRGGIDAKYSVPSGIGMAVIGGITGYDLKCKPQIIRGRHSNIQFSQRHRN